MSATRPCPICQKPSAWEGNPWKPFCSERCRTQDLAAWSSESYRVPDKPEEGRGEGWDPDADSTPSLKP